MREGIQTYLALHTFEEYSKQLQRRGVPKFDADRHSLYLTFRLEGCDWQEATESVNRLIPKGPNDDPAELRS